MLQVFRPGVFFQEVEFGSASRPIEGVNISTGAAVIIAEKGPIGEPQYIVSMEQFVDTFGGFTPLGYGAYAIDGFFKNQGSAIWVVRVAHYDDILDSNSCAALSSFNLAKNIYGENVLRFEATSPGTWGDRISRKIVDGKLLNTELTEPASTGDTSITVKSLRGVRLNQVIDLGEDIESIAAHNTITFTSEVLDGETIIIGTEVYEFDSDESVELGNIAVDITAGATPDVVVAVLTGVINNNSQLVNATYDEELGTVTVTAKIAGSQGNDILTQSESNGTWDYETLSGGKDGSRSFKTVTGIDSSTNTITFTPALTKSLSVGDKVQSREFTIQVYYNNVLVETWESLDINDSFDNFVETEINDERYGSKYIRVYVEHTGDVTDEYPAFDTLPVRLTGGDDAVDELTEVDIIGNSASKTGFYAFNNVSLPLLLFTPESCSETVNNAGMQYCEGRMDCFYIAAVPEAYTPVEAMEYRLDIGNFNSSYAALYYPWIKVVDPIGVGKTPRKMIPPVGHIAGVYARVDRLYGFNQVAAGELAGVWGATGLDYEVADAEQELLNPIGVNCIRSLPGAGIVIWGARTLSSDPKWRYINYRRIFIYCEFSILGGTRWAVFKPNNENLWKQLQRNVTAFMKTVPGVEWFDVVCNEATNPPELRDLGRVTTKIGMALEGVSEFVIFEIGQSKAGAVLTEEAA